MSDLELVARWPTTPAFGVPASVCADTCVSCGAALAVRTVAYWDAETKTVTCLMCRGETAPGRRLRHPRTRRPLRANSTAAPEARRLGVGTSGCTSKVSRWPVIAWGDGLAACIWR
jgi:hypothetical protein